MKRLKLAELNYMGGGHVLQGVVPGKYLSQGGMSFKKPGQRSHDTGCACASCNGSGRHVHANDCEVFILLQGRARMEIDGVAHDMAAGDVVVCEPGEDHHLVADGNDPCVNLWLHASDVRHPEQR